MANTIIAGNATNNGLAFSSDSTGVLNILTGTGSGTTALSIDASQNVSAAANLTVTGSITATNGVSGAIRSGTLVSPVSGTTVDFTGIPTGVKRVTVMLNQVTTNGTTNLQLQLGAGSIETASYVGATNREVNQIGFSTGFTLTFNMPSSAYINTSQIILSNITGNTWMVSQTTAQQTTGVNIVCYGAGVKALSGTLDRLRIISSATGNPSSTFTAGSINILYE